MLRTIALAALFVVPASADEGSAKVQAASPAKPECMCRLRSGRRVPLGTTTCLRVGGREYTARCALSQNVSTWREVAKGCPVG